MAKGLARAKCPGALPLCTLCDQTPHVEWPLCVAARAPDTRAGFPEAGPPGLSGPSRATAQLLSGSGNKHGEGPRPTTSIREAVCVGHGVPIAGSCQGGTRPGSLQRGTAIHLTAPRPSRVQRPPEPRQWAVPDARPRMRYRLTARSCWNFSEVSSTWLLPTRFP